MENFVIEKANVADFDQIYDLLEQCLFKCDENFNVKQVGIYKNIKKTDISNMIVARFDGNIAAAIKVERVKDIKRFDLKENENAYTLERLCVKPEYRNMHIASMIFEYIFKHFTNCTFCCDVMVEPALNSISEYMLKKLGFKYCKKFKWFDDRYNENQNFVYKSYKCKN